MATVKLNNVNKIYDNNVQAVFDFNIDIKDKEFIVFVGPSGCGKSTTLRMIAGLEDISTGELYINNKLMNYTAPKDRHIAMVFQSYALYPHMTVYKNLSFGLKIRKTMRPIYTYDSECKQIELKCKVLRKKYKKISKLFSNAPSDKELAKQEAEIRKELYKNYKLLEEKRKPVLEPDLYRIKRAEKNINKITKDLEKAKKMLGVQESKEKKNDKLIEVIKGDIEYKNKEIKYLKDNIEEYKKGKLPCEKIRKLTKSEIDYQVLSAAEILDLIKYLQRKPAALSGGQRQRVALGRAIVRKPAVFLMDEPLSNLDAKLRIQTRAEIAKIHKKAGATTIYVTHDQTEAMTLADRIVIMKDGYVQQIAKPKEAYGNPVNMFVAGFIGSPATNFVEGSIIKDEFVSDAKKEGAFYLKLTPTLKKLLKKYTGKNVVLGVRPEDAHISKVGLKNPSNLIKGVIKDQELLGHELIAYIGIGNGSFAVKLPADKEYKIGDSISIYFNMDKIYFFDKETTNRIQ